MKNVIALIVLFALAGTVSAQQTMNCDTEADLIGGSHTTCKIKPQPAMPRPIPAAPIVRDQEGGFNLNPTAVDLQRICSSREDLIQIECIGFIIGVLAADEQRLIDDGPAPGPGNHRYYHYLIPRETTLREIRDTVLDYIRWADANAPLPKGTSGAACIYVASVLKWSPTGQ